MSNNPDPKIIDILSKHTGDKPLVSLEYFPPRSDDGVQVRRRDDRHALVRHWMMITLIQVRSLTIVSLGWKPHPMAWHAYLF